MDGENGKVGGEEKGEGLRVGRLRVGKRGSLNGGEKGKGKIMGGRSGKG